MALSNIGHPPSAVQRPASAFTPPSSQLVGCSVASLTPSTSLAYLPFPSHTPDSLRISAGDSALYRNRTVAPHSIVGCRVARLSASASQPVPLPLVVPLRLLVAGWHRWAPPFVGGCLWPPSLSYLTRLTPSTSQLAHLRFIATAPSPPTRSMVVMLPVCLPPPFSQLLCVLLCPSVCWLLCGIVGPLHLLVVASGLPPSPITHAHLTPSASQLAHMRFIATTPSPPTRSMVVMLPVCLPPPFNQLLCLSLCPSTCWLLRGIVGPLHLLVGASGLPPSPSTHASASWRRRQREVVVESCCRQSRDQDLHLLLS